MPKLSPRSTDKTSMEFLNTLEEKINHWLWVMHRFCCNLTPAPIKKFHSFVINKISQCLLALKHSPQYFAKKSKQIIGYFKATLSEVDLKNTIGSYEDKFKHLSHKKFTLFFFKHGAIFLHLVKRPFRGLSSEQTIMLTAFSMASLIAGLAIYSQVQQISSANKTARTPASIEALDFDRPGYYKEEFRHVQISGVRIPVYYPEVNELQTVTIDFNVTLNNRIGRIFIERREFPLRDHLISSLEPVLAKHSLDLEGKTILKEKMIIEIQNFLDMHQIESEVSDLAIIYILAN